MVDSTLQRRENLYAKLYKKGIDVKTARNYNIQEWNANLGTKIKKKASLEGQKRLLTQISIHRKDIVDFYIKKNKITNPKLIKFMEKESKRLTVEVVKAKLPTKAPTKAPKKVGQYNTTKIIDGYGNDKFIKWINIKDFHKQLKKIRDNYGYTSIGTTKTHSYTEFITPEFKKMLAKHQITLGK